MQWFKKCLRQYADFSGRARRAEYWWFAAFQAGVVAVLYILGAIFAGMSAASASIDPTTGAVETSRGGGYVVALLLYGVAALWALALFVPGLAVTVRRLHDTNRSGWWWLISFVPFGSLVLLVFCVMEGTPGPNLYGADPKGRGAGSASQFGQATQFGQAPQFGRAPAVGQTNQFGAAPQFGQFGAQPQQPQQFGGQPPTGQPPFRQS